MFPIRQALRAVSHTPATRSCRLQVRLSQPQKRWATYQRFPGRGGNYGGSGPNKGAGPRYSNFGPFARAQYIWYNHRTAVVGVGGAGGIFYIFNLETVPITGRRRFNCISPDIEKQLGGGGYEDMLNELRGKILPQNHPYTQMVARVVKRLLPATEGLAGEDWKVHVIDDKNMVNAFVMPGGKVFVFTGILPLCQDENGLAAVLGHEIAHNMAHHVAERLSKSIPVTIVSVLGSQLFDVSAQVSGQITQLLLSLPNSRTQEREADHIGLLMMAQSCYDPRKVPDLWRRMAEAEKHAPPQFLSTHPASAARAETIKGWLPEAMARYEQSDCAATSVHVDEFKKIFQNQQAPRGIPRSVFQTSSDENDWF